MWTKLSKYLFMFNENVFICNINIPPSGSTVIDNRTFRFLNTLNVKSKHSRTSNCKDFIEHDILLDDEILFPNNTNIYQRASTDNISDNYGKRFLETCCTTSFIIANVRLGNDQTIGDFTFYSKTGCSVVDYLLLNTEYIEYINDFEIEPLNECSDHCSIVFY